MAEKLITVRLTRDEWEAVISAVLRPVSREEHSWGPSASMADTANEALAARIRKQTR